MLRWATLFLLSFCTLLPASAATLRVTLRPDSADEVSLAGDLVATPVDAADQRREIVTPVGAEQTVLELPKGAWRLRFRSDLWWHGRQFLTIDDSPADIVIPLRRAGRLAGTLAVTDRQSITALEIDLQEVRSPEKPSGELIPLSCPSPVAGKWSCSGPVGQFDVRARVPGYMSQFLSAVTIQPARETPLVTAPFRRGAAVYGQVTLAPDAPPDTLRKTRVSLSPVVFGNALHDRLLSATVTVDRRGVYHFESVRPGKYTLEATAPPNLQSPRLEIGVAAGKESAVRDPLVLQPPKTIALDITPPLDPWGKSWRISLTENRRNFAIPIGVSFSDPDGTWRWAKLDNANYQLEIGPHEEGIWYSEDFTIDQDSVILHATIGSSRVRGSVRLGETPLREAKITFAGSHGNRRIVLHSDQNGEVEGILPDDDRYGLLIEAETPPVSRKLDEVPMRSTDDGRRFEVTIPTTYLMVTVVDSKGEPVGGALVSIYSQDRLAQRGTEGDGKIEVVGLADGKVKLQATAFLRESPLIEVAVEENGRSEARLQLSDQVVLHGVVLSPTGTPVVGAIVWPVAADQPYLISTGTSTEADGHFTHFVSPGARVADIALYPPGFALKIIRVPLDGTPITLVANPDGGELSVKMSTADHDARGINPYLIHDGGLVGLNTVLFRWPARTADADGIFTGTLAMMEPGTYSLCLLRQGDRLAAGRSPDAFGCKSGYLPPGGKLSLSLLPK
jgi:hypothetical protein